MKAASSSDHSIHIVILLLPLMGFAFDRIPDLLFKVGFCVVVFMTGDHDSARKSIVLKFPVRPLSTGDLTPAGGFQVLNQFSSFARHREIEQAHAKSGSLVAALARASFPTAT